MLRLVAGALVLFACGEQPGTATDSGQGEPPCASSVASQLDPAALEAHLTALADIAQAHGDRAAGSTGYAASVDYVDARLRELGLDPERMPFEHSVVAATEALELVLLTEAGNEELAAPAVRLSFVSGSGTAENVFTDVARDVPGCGACTLAAWSDFPEGTIAWTKGTTSDLGELAFSAVLHGASALLVEVAEDEPERLWDPRGPRAPGLPIVLVGRAVAEQIASAESLRISVTVDRNHRVTSHNVIADLVGSEPGPSLVIGAHLDSVEGSAGINDNGTGVATLLEIARGLAQCEPRRTVRIAFWGAEEWGLRGSEHYVQHTTAGPSDVRAYLNIDMLGSTNGGYYVGGDRGAAAPGARLGAALEAEGAVWLWDQTLAGRSDHAPFQAVSIPIASLVSGAEALVDDNVAATFDRQAGRPHDPCYHRPCDDLGNVDREQFFTAARAMGSLAEALATEP